MTTFPLSPGTNFTEYDSTIIAPAISSSVGGLAGVFSWGPVGKLIHVSSQNNLVQFLGTPTNNNYETFYSAWSFLAYDGADSLLISRAANTTTSNSQVSAYNAIANIGSTTVLSSVTINSDIYQNKLGTYDPNVLYIAKYVGVPGNSLRISVCDTAAAYNSTLTVNNAVATGTLNVNTGSNVAYISVSPQGSGTLNDVYSLAMAISANIAVGDLISVGNSSIGSQYLQVSNIGLSVNTGSNTAIAINLVDPYRLSHNWANTTINRWWEFHTVTGKAPGQSAYQLNNGNTAANDQLSIVVVDDNGYFSKAPGTVLEVYNNVSRATDAVNVDGTTNYYVNLLANSQYVRWVNDNPNAVSNTAQYLTNSTNIGVTDLYFTLGSDGASESNVQIGDLLTAWNYFQNKDTVPVSLLITGKSIGGVTGEQVMNYISDNITTIRKDCVVFGSPNKESVVNNYGNEVFSVSAFRNQCRLSSYSFLDSGYKWLYDSFNNCYRWVPLNGDTAGLAAQIDYNFNPWWAFSGIINGVIKNVTKLAYNPSLADRNILFPLGVNPVIQKPNIGIVLYGDKTLYPENSVFNAINVRRLFIYVEQAILKVSEAFLWQFNDSYTQAQFRNAVNPTLRIIKGGRGISSYLVICDGTNNTAPILQNDMLVADFYIVPEHAIRNIQLNFIATPDGVSFSEVELPVI